MEQVVCESTTKPLNKKPSVPPEGYVCKLCQTSGHWIQRCPEKKKHGNKNKKKNPDHVHRPGIDPSRDDIEKAKALQKLKPPPCFCLIPSRLKKVKRSFATSGSSNNNNSSNARDNNNDNESNYDRPEPDYENSRAIGNYFFFCSKKRDDHGKCRFARPVEDHDAITPRSQRICTFFQKTGSCRKGDACAFSHDVGKVVTPTPRNNDNKRKRNKQGEIDRDTEQKKKKDDNDVKDDDSSSSSDSDGDDDENDDKNETTTTTTAGSSRQNDAKTTTEDSSSDSSDSDSDDEEN